MYLVKPVYISCGLEFYVARRRFIDALNRLFIITARNNIY